MNTPQAENGRERAKNAMEIQTKTTRFFFCRNCFETDGGECRRLRAMPAGRVPSVPCESCGGVEWGEFDEDERPAIVDRLGRKNIHGARLFFCRRCGDESFQILHGAEKLKPCDCKSRYFVEIIGPARIDWLRKNGGRDA